MQEKTIEVEGKAYTFNYGIGFLSKLLERLEVSITGLDKAYQENPFKAIPVMIQASLEMDAYLNQKQEVLEHREVLKLIDQTGGLQGEFVQAFLDGFNRSREDFTDPKAGKAKPKAARKSPRK